MITASSETTIFDSMLGDIDYPKDSEVGKLYPFKVRCGVIKRRPPRHEFFQFIIDMGRNNIDRVLKHQAFGQKPPTELTFVFPERWMGVAEQQGFMSRLKKHPDAENIERVNLLTSSPIMVSDFMREHLRILTWEDDAAYDADGRGV